MCKVIQMHVVTVQCEDDEETKEDYPSEHCEYLLMMIT